MKSIRYPLLCICLFFILPLLRAQPTITATSNIGVGSSASFSGVAYGAGKYIAVGYGRVHLSADGDNWSPVSHVALPSTVDFTDIKFGNNLFVISGSGGQLITSPDGVTWTAQNSGTTNRIAKLAFLNSKFFAVGSLGTLLTSADGLAWSAVNIGGSNHLLVNIAYGAGMYVIAAQQHPSGLSYSFTSATGASGSWTLSTVLPGASSINNVFYLKDRFWAVHSGTEVLTSTNGTSWTVATSTPVTNPNGSASTIGTPNHFFNGLYDGTTIYFFGYGGYQSSYGGVFTSTTGNSFTLQPRSNSMTPTNCAYVGGRYFILGSDGLLSSADGTTWKAPGGSFNSLATNGSDYVAVSNTNTNDGQIFSSSNFSTWSNRTPGWVNALYGVTWGNNKYMAVGNAGTVVTSTDGVNWTAGSSGDADMLRSVAYGGGVYVAVGNQGKIMYSANEGASWTQAKKDGTTGSNFYGVYYINGRFIAIGGGITNTSATRVEYSTNGSTWTAASPSIIGHFSGIAWDGSKYLLTGRDNTTGSQKFFSVTNADITNAAGYSAAVTLPASSTGGIDIGAVGYGAVARAGNRFIAIANQKTTPFSGYILQSTNGTSWTAYPANTTARLRGLVTTSQNFRIVGTEDTKVSVNYNTALPLKLEGFTAQPVGASVQLNWKTAGEVNTTSFDVERSVTGRTYTTAGRVRAIGSGGNTYSFEDVPGTWDKTLYYRLKLIDGDGQFTYSPVRMVMKSGSTAVLQVYPNPAQESFKLNLPAGITTGQVSLYDGAGTLVMTKTYTAGSGVTISSLAPGAYRVELSAGNTLLKAAFIKQ